MTSRKNSKTEKSGAARKSSFTESQSGRGGLRKFFQRLCIYGLTLIGMLLIYFVMGGDSKKLIGVKTPDEASSNQSAANNNGVTHSVGKPVMDENGNPIQKVSDDSEMFGSDFDEILATGAEPEYGSTDSETSPETGYGSGYGTSGQETSQGSDSGSGSSSGSGSDYSSGSGSDYSSGSGSDYSSGSGSDYSSGSGSDYSSGSGSDYSSGTGSDYSGSYGSGSNYSSGSSSDYSSGSGYSTGSGSDYSGSSSSGSAGGGLVSSSDASGLKADSQGGSFMDFPPETPPIKNYKEGVVTGPDGRPRHNEVKILEVGRGEPMKNHFGPAVSDFLDLFDFSITPDWVEANWSSVAIVGPLTTRGYRVPISTGPEPSDLVGSLTYYFNNRLELEKITFEGYTGDLDRILISLKYFNLTKRITSDPNALLYLSEELSDHRRSFLKSYFRLQSHDKAEPNKRYWLTIELYPPEK